MKFKVAADELSLIAKSTLKGLNVKDPHSQTVFKIDEEQEKLFLYCTTQTTFFKGAISIFDLEKEAEDSNEWSIDGNQLKTILSIIPSISSIPIEFNMNNKTRNFVLKVKKDTFKLPVFDVVSPYYEEEKEKIALVPANDFINKVSLLGKMVSTDVDDEDMAVSCLHLIFEKDILKIMGTDNFSMAEEKINYNLEGKEEKILIPVGQVSLLIRPFDNTEEIALISTETKFGYIDKNGVVSLVSKSSMSPLAYESRIRIASESCSERTIKISSNDFKQSISALSKLATNSNIITMNVKPNDGTIVFSNINEDVMTINLLESNTEEKTIYFTKESLQNIEALLSERIQIGWSSDEFDLFVKFTNYLSVDEDNEILDENVFIGVSTNEN